jgi:hypothetical protein
MAHPQSRIRSSSAASFLDSIPDCGQQHRAVPMPLRLSKGIRNAREKSVTEAHQHIDKEHTPSVHHESNVRPDCMGFSKKVGDVIFIALPSESLTWEAQAKTPVGKNDEPCWPPPDDVDRTKLRELINALCSSDSPKVSIISSRSVDTAPTIQRLPTSLLDTQGTDDEGRPATEQLKASVMESLSQRFACPYHQRSPAKYQKLKSCASSEYVSIHRLK